MNLQKVKPSEFIDDIQIELIEPIWQKRAEIKEGLNDLITV